MGYIAMQYNFTHTLGLYFTLMLANYYTGLL